MEYVYHPSTKSRLSAHSPLASELVSDCLCFGCGKRVSYHPGNTNEAHFRHYKNTADPNCEYARVVASWRFSAAPPTTDSVFEELRSNRGVGCETQHQGAEIGTSYNGGRPHYGSPSRDEIEIWIRPQPPARQEGSGTKFLLLMAAVLLIAWCASCTNPCGI